MSPEIIPRGALKSQSAKQRDDKFAVNARCQSVSYSPIVIIIIIIIIIIAFENLGVPNASAKLLLTHLGKRLSEKSRESRETSFLFQRCSVLLQRFKAVLLHESMPACDRIEF